MIYKRLFFLVLLLFLPLFLLSISGLEKADVGSVNAYPNSYVSLDSPSKEKKVFLIIIDRIGLSDLYYADTPIMDSIIQQGGIGLMTTNTGGNRSQRDVYLTMGAGTRVTASDKSPLGLHVHETYQGNTAGDLYMQISGRIPPEKAIVNLGFAQAIRNNERRSYTVAIGALGAALRQSGLRTAVIGNSDTPGEYKRYLVSFLMDGEGMVPDGDVSRNTYVEDQSRPFGIRTNYSRIMQSLEDLWYKTDVFAIQLGDTSRAEDFRYEATDTMNEEYKRLAIEESDTFIGNLIEKIDFNRDLLLITAPLGPVRDLNENNRLTPVIIMGQGYTKGMLTSASTKRPGILTNLDISTTIMSHYGIPRQGGQLGNRIYSSGEEMEVDELLQYNIRLKEINNHRTPLLRSYVSVLILLLAASLLCIFFIRRYLTYAGFFLQFIMAVPISYLMLPFFHHSTLAGSLGLSWLLALGMTSLVSTRKWSMLTKIGLYCLLISIILIIDQFFGARLIAASPLGYDIISGARYYGIGNEYMGVLIGAVCTGTGVFCQSWACKGKPVSGVLLLPIFTLPLLVLAHPGIGANVGGTITALVAFSSFIVLNWKDQIRVRHLVSIGLSTVAFIIMLFIFDSLRAIDIQSHMGQTVSLIRKNGFLELFYIAKRKIEMNIKLFRYTIWTRVFLLSLLSIVLLLFRPVGIFRNLSIKFPYLIKGIISGVIGCITALLVNDSGIVAAGTSMVYLAPPVLLTVMEHLPDRGNRFPWRKRKI